MQLTTGLEVGRVEAARHLATCNLVLYQKLCVRGTTRLLFCPVRHRFCRCCCRCCLCVCLLPLPHYILPLLFIPHTHPHTPTHTPTVFQILRGSEMLFAALYAVLFLHRPLNRCGVANWVVELTEEPQAAHCSSLTGFRASCL